ncbi:MAG: hypothetical protein IT521_08535 [Burkholderiales bacterium]|nr:hypothetical protein [Burkholderiales bacterium]
MIGFDWSGLMIGTLAGGALGALFFAGLAWGMKVALRRPNPVAILLPSAAVRIAALLAGGWVIAAWLGVAGALGFALAFLGLRFILVARIRARMANEAG